MLHIVHLIERRFPGHAPRAAARLVLLSASALLLGLALLVFPPRGNAADAPEAVALALLDRLDAADYAGAERMFTAQMAAAVPAGKLKSLWEALPAQLGAAQGRGEAQVMPNQGMQVVSVPLHYADGGLLAQVAVDAEGRVAGFFLRPAPPPPAAAPAADAAYEERDFAVPAAKGALPGTLALPKGAGKFPAVVLVHGSGPQDRDETVGPNRPFLDIARGLATQGIAVLRYEKRSKARPQDFAGGDYTVDDETTDDAVLAVAALAQTAGIDPSRIFVFGHSQGGMLAPRIAAKSGKVAGAILFAAPARPLLDILPEQNRYLLSLDGSISSEEQIFLDDLQAKIAAVRGGGAIAARDTPMGLPARYWREFDRIDPLADANSLALPLLLLHGGRDIQVTDADWQLWRKALQGDKRATLKHYPTLNHLGIAGEGPGSLQEYQRPGQVDAQLIADVAAWIKAR